MGRAAAAFLEEQGEAATSSSSMETGQCGDDLAAGLPPCQLWHSTALNQLLWVLRRREARPDMGCRCTAALSLALCEERIQLPQCFSACGCPQPAYLSQPR